MATKKSTKKTTKKAPAKAPVKHSKSVSECTMKECIQMNKVLKLHVTIITILSLVVCALVAALVLALKD